MLTLQAGNGVNPLKRRSGNRNNEGAQKGTGTQKIVIPQVVNKKSRTEMYGTINKPKERLHSDYLKRTDKIDI